MAPDWRNKNGQQQLDWQLGPLGSNKLHKKKPSSSSSGVAAVARASSSSHRSRKHQKNHRHHNHHQQQPAKDHDELEKRHRKYAKEKYQRKVERAHKMQLQRDQKLEHQTRQLAEYERQHQARQKVYFGNFAEEHQKQFDSIADIDKHIDGVGEGSSNRERYPNLVRLQSQLKEDRDKELPPYVRKYNRRNKQLFDLIAGTNSPDSPTSNAHQQATRRKKHHHHNHNHHHYRSQAAVSTGSKDHLTHKEKIERWIEENLFEEQRRNPNQIVRPPEEQLDPESELNKLNALPGELGPAAPDGLEEEQHAGQHLDTSKSGAAVNLNTNRLSQTRAGNFVYHRIAQSQPSNTIGQAYGVIVRKPGLPFVAITDRRQEQQQHQQSGRAKHIV